MIILRSRKVVPLLLRMSFPAIVFSSWPITEPTTVQGYHDAGDKRRDSREEMRSWSVRGTSSCHIITAEKELASQEELSAMDLILD
jgi:hypothetical protein